MTRILSLDDDPKILEVLHLLLEDSGYKSLITTSETEALSILRSQSVDLFTQDVIRPGMNGWEFLRLMKSDASLRHIPVLVISAVPISSQTEQLMLYGLDLDRDLAAYLEKPVESTDLLERIEALTRVKPGERSTVGTYTKAQLDKYMRVRLSGGGGEQSALEALATLEQEPPESEIDSICAKRGHRIVFTVTRLVVAGMLVWALAKHAYGYYQFLRVATTVVCVFGVYCALNWKQMGWAWCFGLLAALFNPLIPLRLERLTWNLIDVAVALLLVVSIFTVQPNRPEFSGNED